jgi:lysophospholipase L1-like esterase
MVAVLRTTALAAGCFGGLGAAYGLLSEQSRRARRAIGPPVAAPLRADGCYLPDGTGPLAATDPRAADPIRLAMLGDSSAAGLGADVAVHLPGVLVARGLAEEARRPVVLTTSAVSGSTSRSLGPQVQRALTGRPHAAVLMIGANDVTRRISPQLSATLLENAVRALGEAGVEVVVGTCPDLGVVRPIPQPLRGVAGTWSRALARRQRVAVLRAGGHAVPLADLLAAEFLARDDFFSADRFHPSNAGYEATAAVLLPAVCAALGIWGGTGR